jgi:hypothetical protein
MARNSVFASLALLLFLIFAATAFCAQSATVTFYVA